MKHFTTFALLVLNLVLCSAQTQLVTYFHFDNSLDNEYGNGVCTQFGNDTSWYNNGEFYWQSNTNPGGGLKFSIPDGDITEENYTLLFYARLSEISGYRKIIDFSNLLEDQGVYVNDQLRLYSIGSFGDSTLSPNTRFGVVFTRNSTNDSVHLYILTDTAFVLQSKGADYSQQFIPVLEGNNRVFHFFHDDNVTSTEYSPSGSMAFIQILNGVLKEEDFIDEDVSVNNTPGTTLKIYPNPSSDFIWVDFGQDVSGTVSIYDVQGKILTQSTVTNQSVFSANIQSFERGMYILHFGNNYSRFIKK